MNSFDKCPVCGHDLEEKKVEKLLRGGPNTAVIEVQAQVCHHCGERLYNQQTVRLFQEIRNKLQRQETKDFQPLGQSFSISQNDFQISSN